MSDKSVLCIVCGSYAGEPGDRGVVNKGGTMHRKCYWRTWGPFYRLQGLLWWNK